MLCGLVIEKLISVKVMSVKGRNCNFVCKVDRRKFYIKF